MKSVNNYYGTGFSLGAEVDWVIDYNQKFEFVIMTLHDKAKRMVNFFFEGHVGFLFLWKCEARKLVENQRRIEVCENINKFLTRKTLIHLWIRDLLRCIRIGKNCVDFDPLELTLKHGESSVKLLNAKFYPSFLDDGSWLIQRCEDIK